MAVWEDSGLQWSCGMAPLCESDFVCIEDRYYLNNSYVSKENEWLRNAKKAWQIGDQPRSLQILTFPAYCRYRALKKRLLCGACLSRAQLVALGAVMGDQRTNTKVLFCRDSFHHPYLDKFELSGDNKAPVLKGRPRKKKKLSAAQNSVLKKKRFVADIQNHLDSLPSAKRYKMSEGDESANSSDLSEGALERVKVPSKAAQSNGPPPLVKPPKVQASSTVVAAVVPSLGNCPPLLSAKSNEEDSQHILKLRQGQAEVVECSQTTALQGLVDYSKYSKPMTNVKVSNSNKTVLLDTSAKADSIQTGVTCAPLTKPSSSLESGPGKIELSTLDDIQASNPQVKQTASTTQSNELTRTITADLAGTTSFSTSTRPVATTQGTFESELAVCTGAVVRIQPVASLPQPVVSAQATSPRPQQYVTKGLTGTVTSGIRTSDEVTATVSSGIKTSSGITADGSLTVRSKTSKENEERLLQSRQTACLSHKKKEKEVEQSEEAIAWRKKKKRLRMPGSVKDEVYDDEDEKYFMQMLRDFMKKTNQPLGKLPALGFKKVNLWTMYTTAQRFGGYDAVTSKRLWRRVYDSLGGSTTITSAATYTRRHYERLLLPYERHMRSQLKKQMDEKNPCTVNETASKETLSKADKKQGLTVSNKKHNSSGSLDDAGKAAPVKHTPTRVEANASKVPQEGVTHPLTSKSLPVNANFRSDSKTNSVKSTNSSHTMQISASTTVKKDVVKSDLPPAVRPITQENQESKLLSNNTKATVSQQTPLPVQERDNLVPPEQFHLPPGQLNARHHSLMDNDDETSARTNTIYAKNTTGFISNSKQSAAAGCLQRVTRVVSDISPKSSSPQLSNTAIKAREIIDLTSDDSPPQSRSKSHSVSLAQVTQQNAEMSKMQGSEGNEPDVSKLARTVGAKDSTGRRLASKIQLKRENDDSSRHFSIAEVQPRNETSPLYDSPTYNVEPQGTSKLKVSQHLPASSPVSAMKKNLDEVYPSVKPGMVFSKRDKKRHLQSMVESAEPQFTHSSSCDSVDEHFAEWLRRQANVPQLTKPPVSHQRHTSPCNPELGKLKYGYVPEDTCPPDCPCSLSKTRKDENMLLPLPKPKKEHYEEDLPFASMTWAPTMVAAGHPDHYIYSHPAHLRPPPDSLASHVYSASRIFIPTAQLFSPQYHLGMGPMGAPPLLPGTEDQLHIHPHCLMAPSYPSSSSSRTPDGAAYPLYSFT